MFRSSGRASTPSPSLAAAMSFLLPGLGQLSLGAVPRGLLLAAPWALLVGAGIAAASTDRSRVLDLLVRPELLASLLVLNLALVTWRAAAIVDAYRLATATRPSTRTGDPASPARRRSGAFVLVVLLAATIAIHGGAEYLGIRAYQTLDAVFRPGDEWVLPPPASSPSPSPVTTPDPTPSPSPSPRPRPSPTPTPSPTPSPKPVPAWAEDGRLNLLLIGSDAGPDRVSVRTDTMILLSVDVASGRAALFGIPRNLVGVPLSAESADAFVDGRFPGLLNALYRYAMDHPRHFPGGEARGWRAVGGAIQELAGVRIDGMVGVNLAGFVRLVDALGGLWIDVPARLVDERYPLENGGRLVRIDIRPGCQHLDGRMALAYARSRHQDSDYGRMARQQQVLVALRRQLDPVALLPEIPTLLDIAGDTLWTTIGRDDVGELADLGTRVDATAVSKVLFVPPRYPSHLTDAEIDRIRSVVGSAFDAPPVDAHPAPSAPARACP